MANVESRERREGLRFRAKVQVLGLRKVGPWRADPLEAQEDAIALKREGGVVADRPLTIGEAVAKRISEAKAAGVQENTIGLYEQLGNRLSGHVWHSSTPLRSIDAKELVAYARRCLKPRKDAEGEELPPERSVNTILEKDFVFLGSLCKLAGISPCPVEEARKRLKLRRTNRRRSFLTPAEVKDLLHRVRSMELSRPCPARERHADILTLVAFTGIRSGELCRCKVEDLELEADPPALVIPQPKDRSNPRRVPLAGAGLAAAKRLAKTSAEAEEELLIPGDSKNYVGNIVRRWQDRLDEPRLSLRTLRHSFVTALLFEGVEPVQVMFLAGHKSLTTTMKYVHEIRDRSAEAVERLNGLFA